MKAIQQTNKSSQLLELSPALILGGVADLVAFVASAIAKRKHPLCVVRYMWRARSDCGRWLG